MGGGPAGEGEAWAGKAGRKFKSLGGRRGRKYATKKRVKDEQKTEAVDRRRWGL